MLYEAEAKRRMGLLYSGELPYRPLGKPIHQPTGREKVSQAPKSQAARATSTQM